VTAGTRSGPRLGEPELQRAARLLSDGKSLREVAKTMGISRPAAAQLAARLQGAISERKAGTS
jgi:hypothetical protein